MEPGHTRAPAWRADRAARARALAERCPASREALAFVAEVAAWQGEIAERATSLDALLALREPLLELVRERGPAALRREADDVDEGVLRQALDDYLVRRDTTSPRSLFARVLLQPFAAANEGQAAARQDGCPRCGHDPQVGLLRPLEHGSALSLACSLCLHEWPHARRRCVACGAPELVYWSAPEIAHLRLQACEACKRYHHTIDLAVEPQAVADIDELVALPLDVWARERGYRKVQPNLAGI